MAKQARNGAAVLFALGRRESTLEGAAEPA
jgi:hypothetical protein